jgi:ATP-dependent helicase/nuclease subunit A
MEPPRTQSDLLTPSQRQAVAARGNVLVMAGAGTGKTHTLVERCLDCLVTDRASLDEILIVTFTEAAATEMRQRLRRALENLINTQPATPDSFCAEQLALFDAAHIGTLHGFCLKLIREHFYELGLDPQLAMLDAGEARLRANETLDEQLQEHYAGQDELSEAVQELIHIYGGGRDEKIRTLILRLHNYAQTRPAAEGWLAAQIGKFSAAEPADWHNWLLAAIADWRDEWLPVLKNLKEGNEKAAELAGILSRLQSGFAREAAVEILELIVAADLTVNYPKGKAGKLRPALGDIFDEAAFLGSLAMIKNGHDPLTEDWNWVRGPMGALLQLAQNFSIHFAERKRADGVLDFHDLEQFALKLLWDFNADRPTATATHWREKLKFVFVDEYQDINAAQDKIIIALSRDATTANRFLVGDVKQSIYRFRLADPKIFRDYARDWRGKTGATIPLTENFRSRESLIQFVNSVFTPLMREEIGGVAYDAKAQLKFGAPEKRADFSATRDASPRAELLLRFKTGRSEPGETEDETGADELADLGETEKEARRLANRLQELRAGRHEIWDDERKIFRAVEWRDMAVLLRAVSGKSEIYAMEFERAGVPLVVERGGFYDSSEIADLLSLLQLLDNPLQDVPCIAVLRSPLVGLSLDELAQIRMAAPGHFWFAVQSVQNSKPEFTAELRSKITKFLERFARWRKLARQASLSRCLEAVLTETHYADWLRSRPRGAQRHANVGRFLNLAQKFDQFQRQGLYRFLKFIEAQRDAEVEPDVASGADENAVRLMSIHQSKGLEFPVVALADLAKPFNRQDLRGEIIFDEAFGLCPKVKPPQTGRRYASLPHWLAQRHQLREQAGEELRLLYVALTRARDTLILTGSITEKKWTELWTDSAEIPPQKITSAKSYADWLGLWFARQPGANSEMQGELANVRWRIADDAELKSIGSSRDDKALIDLQLDPPHVGCHEDKRTLDAATLEKLRAVLTWKYPFNAATERAAKSSVTALRREAADEPDDEADQIFPARRSIRTKLSAADTGTAHHKFLQHVPLENVGEPDLLTAAAVRLERENILSSAERAALDLKAISTFWNSAVGQKIRQHTADVKRELAFTARFSPAELGEITGKIPASGLDGEFIVVQGVADLVMLLPQEIWLVDFKTDDVRAGNLPEKTKLYAPQLKLYANALAKIYSRPVTNCWLHFLAAQRTEKI